MPKHSLFMKIQVAFKDHGNQEKNPSKNGPQQLIQITNGRNTRKILRFQLDI